MKPEEAIEKVRDLISELGLKMSLDEYREFLELVESEANDLLIDNLS